MNIILYEKKIITTAEDGNKLLVNNRNKYSIG